MSAWTNIFRVKGVGLDEGVVLGVVGLGLAELG